MSERKVYHVLPATEGGWQVKEESVQLAASRHETKEPAVSRAKEMAKANDLGQVIIHKRDGTIQTEYTYGEDSSPPEG